MKEVFWTIMNDHKEQAIKAIRNESYQDFGYYRGKLSAARMTIDLLLDNKSMVKKMDTILEELEGLEQIYLGTK